MTLIGAIGVCASGLNLWSRSYFRLVKSMDSWIIDTNPSLKLIIFVFTENAYRPIGVEKIGIISFNNGIMTSANALLPR